MDRALALARQALGQTSPNPLVGAVVLDETGRLVGEGYHHRAGEPHAERLALAQAGAAAQGGTLYVTLEPCSHYGRTPPCVDAVIASGVRRVVAAMVDPNPLVAGRGIARLRQAGIDVQVGVREEQAQRLNEPFVHYITTGRPLGVWKAAMTLDGKIATVAGESRWISGEAARALVHEWRQTYDVVLVGSGTILRDDPQLTTRRAGGRPGRDPVAVVVDSSGRVPVNARLFTTPRTRPPVLATTERCPQFVRDAWARAGAQVWVVAAEPATGRVDLADLWRRLGEAGLTSVLIESGGEVAYSALAAGLVQRVNLFIAPLLFGGASAPTPLGGTGIRRLSDAWRLTSVEVSQIGDDVLITGRVRSGTGPNAGQKGKGSEAAGCSRES
ncbi:MAG: bifunctional diaminohydroxyphosphoribosylaminopyrimidine deaminase/5-amino-6-(5-phosphoribosylamino)uracil reductase RibD [Limnochordaceae bacterium]|nr:bifunctional diaminohydroxyphosphoribosylaminopyrimidine deaminase/5-amino-6-(5-phosphoribosylamino)uracil reductase RibD [Limnochordaceae bacterium]